MFTFSFEWWNWPKYWIFKCQMVVFSITVSIIVQKLKFCKIEIEYTHITLLSAWDRSCDSTAKRTLSKHMWRSLLCGNGFKISIAQSFYSLKMLLVGFICIALPLVVIGIAFCNSWRIHRGRNYTSLPFILKGLRQSLLFNTVYGGAFCQFSFRWINYCHNT